MKLTVDYHCHLLPEIDDGAKTPEITRLMMQVLFTQGIRVVYGTPHFLPHVQSQESFLTARNRALQKALPLLPEGMRLIPAAEVALCQGISETCDLKQVTLGNSRCILLELPFSPRTEWLIHEIDNIVYGHGLRPVFAHIERYVDYFKKDLFDKILSTEGAMFQFSNRALSRRYVRKLFLSLCENGCPILLGSDAHNVDSRPPDFYLAEPQLAKLFKKGIPESFQRLTE